MLSVGAFVPQPGDENELRAGFRGVFRPHALKRRNRSVSESYSMDVRQQGSSDRQAAQQFQKRVRRLSGGPSSTTSQDRRRAESLGPSTSQVSVSSSGRVRSNSFNSERTLESSSSNSKHSNSKDANQSTSSKTRVNFDLRKSEPGTSNACSAKSNSPDQISGCNVHELQDSTSGSFTYKPVPKKKESYSSRNSVEKQKRTGDSVRDATTSKDRDVTELVSLSKTKHENRSVSSPNL
ncbi:hypothetical protein Cfor_11222 [Coptotermes formosanus]|uniref:Uncharacterized protein n=1 Tax=Coptotermes formosanus TaxID=36987 RepID=A0A6L2Q184_COPFO|nr:hypothetical protein Cfor_11222 [Coptotermes formosanus]